MKNNITRSFLAPICCLIVLWSLAGCGYKKAEEKGTEIFPEVQKFNHLFENTNHKVGYLSGIGGPLLWGSKGMLYDHYLIYMGYEISLDFFRTPQRTSSIKVRVDQYEYSYATGSKRRARSTLGVLSPEQWEQVKEPDDIFRFLDHTPIKNEPIDGIEDDLKFY